MSHPGLFPSTLSEVSLWLLSRATEVDQDGLSASYRRAARSVRERTLKPEVPPSLPLWQRFHGIGPMTCREIEEFCARERLHLPFEILSDAALALQAALKLPTFSTAGMELYKRLTLIAHDGRIEKVFYPIFPSDRNAGDVLAWLRER